MAKRIKITLRDLDVRHVKKMLEIVKFDAERGDDEAAAGREYDMWQWVLKAVAAKNPDAPALARVALKSAKLEFRRG